MKILGENYGIAKIFAKECERLGKDEVSVKLEDCSGSNGNKRNLIRVSVLGWENPKSCIWAMSKIRDLADKHRCDLVIDLVGRDNPDFEDLCKKTGFNYINDRHEMMRRYSLVKYLKYRISDNLGK